MQKKKDTGKKIPATEKRSGRFLVLSVSLMLLFVVLIAGVWSTTKANNAYQNRIEEIYQHAYYEYLDALKSIEFNLSKMMVSQDSVYGAELAAETYCHAEAANLMLTTMPFPEDEIADTEKFLNQIGDWCLSYSRRMLLGLGVESYRDQIEELYVTAASLNSSVTDDGRAYLDGGFKQMANLKHYSGNPSNTQSVKKAGSAEETPRVTVEYPEMIYDGPFSDSQSERCYKTFSDIPVLGEEAVAESIRQKSPVKVEKLTLLGQSECKARCYEYEAETEWGKAYFSASEYGGKIMNFSLQKTVTEAKISEEEARVKAQEYVARLGFEAEPVWYNYSEGAAVVNLAPIKDGIVYYTDLVKVKLALDDGSLLGIEAKSYCMNHCVRTKSAKIKADTAKSLIPQNLSVQRCCLAMVPTKDGGEELCYELRCELKGLEYFIYLSADSGKEVNVLRIIDSDQGLMTF